MSPTIFRSFILLFMLGALSAGVRGQTAAELMAKGDQFDQQLKASQALDCYLPASKLDPNNV